MAVITAKVVLEQRKELERPSLRLPTPTHCTGATPTRATRRGEITHTHTHTQSCTIRCLYSSEASCTAVSHALGLLEYTLPGSSFQYLQRQEQITSLCRSPFTAGLQSPEPLLYPQKTVTRCKRWHFSTARAPLGTPIANIIFVCFSFCFLSFKNAACRRRY